MDAEFQVVIYDIVNEQIVEYGSGIWTTREDAMKGAQAIVDYANSENQFNENWDALVWDVSDCVILINGHLEL